MHPAPEIGFGKGGNATDTRNCGVDEDQLDLMKVALSNASKRVVLKWPAKAAPMAGLLPCSHQVMGKSTRYDVFMLPLKMTP